MCSSRLTALRLDLNERRHPIHHLEQRESSQRAHTLSAVARDPSGNQSEASDSITVSNATQFPAGLVAAYGFNEDTGTQALDASGLGNNGSLSGATRSLSGHSGGAASFNGTNASVIVPDSNSLDLTNGMTVEAWVRPTAGSGWRTVVLKESSGNLSYALYAANGASRPVGWITNPTRLFSPWNRGRPPEYVDAPRGHL